MEKSTFHEIVIEIPGDNIKGNKLTISNSSSEIIWEDIVTFCASSGNFYHNGVINTNGNLRLQFDPDNIFFSR